LTDCRRRGAGAPLPDDALPGAKALLRFGTAEGAGDHCQMRNRTLLDQRVFDWLDDVL
jgi:hypothetical protein